MDNFNQSNVAQSVPRGKAQPTHAQSTRSFALARDIGAGCGAVGDNPLNELFLNGGCEGLNLLGQDIPFAQLYWPVPNGPRQPQQMPIFGSANIRIPPAPFPDGRVRRMDLQAVPLGRRHPQHRSWMGMPLRPAPVGHGLAPVVPNGPRRPRQQAVMGCPSNLTYMFYRVYGTIIH